MDLDDTDRQILRVLGEDALTSKAEIGRRIGLTSSAVFERLRRLRERGVIQGYEVLIDPAAVGLHLLAYVFVTEAKPVHGERTASRLARIPQVEEVHKIAGEDCFLVKVRAQSTADLGRILDDEITAIESVRDTRTTIVLESIVEGRQAAFTCLEDERSA